jgi:hypothetical protein
MCFGGRDKQSDEGAARSRELDKIIRADEKRMAKEVKLLLLGTKPALTPMAPRTPQLTSRLDRRRRVRKIDGAEADEAYLCARIQQK